MRVCFCQDPECSGTRQVQLLRRKIGYLPLQKAPSYHALKVGFDEGHVIMLSAGMVVLRANKSVRFKTCIELMDPHLISLVFLVFFNKECVLLKQFIVYLQPEIP